MQNLSKPWTAVPMMIISILAVCILVPAAFIFNGTVAGWFQSLGFHSNPNIAGGYPIAEFTGFEQVVVDPSQNLDSAEIHRALALRKFSVNKVSFRRWTGVGIAPRLNLTFEFEGPLPDPQNSPQGFSMTVIHVYVKAPGKESGDAHSNRAANVDFGSPGWNYQVIVDGFHDQARIFDSIGNLVATGLGLYVDHEMKPGTNQSERSRSGTTRITAALPLMKIGDPAQGNWRFYLLAGISDLHHPSMMLHSAPESRLNIFCGALMPNNPPAGTGRIILRPLEIRNPS